MTDFAGRLAKPDFGAEEPEHEELEPEAQLRANALNLEEALIGGKRVLTRKEVAQLAGVSTYSARKFWRALGLPQIPAGKVAYTMHDVGAISAVASLVDEEVLDEVTAMALVRAVGHTTDRLVVWQMESLVEFLTDTRGFSDLEARSVVMPLLEKLLDPLEGLLVYSWKHNMSNVLSRLNVNVGDGLAMENREGWFDSAMPLARAVGFADLVSYTRLSQQMEPKQLAKLVKKFQDLAYAIVATGGGRIIKTVGDEVYYAAETPLAGAEISMSLQEQISADSELPEARVGFSWGKVLSRMGDIFGSTVNLAARLTAMTEPGTVMTDVDTASIIQRSDDYVFSNRRNVTLQGLGTVAVTEMTRGSARAIDLDLTQ